MKKALIVALVCINAALLLALVLGYGTPPAKAQVAGGATDYLMVTGRLIGEADAVYIIDLAKRRMAAWRFDKTNNKMVPMSGHELKRDFDRKD
jgi:hypothetical protein